MPPTFRLRGRFRRWLRSEAWPEARRPERKEGRDDPRRRGRLGSTDRIVRTPGAS